MEITQQLFDSVPVLRISGDLDRLNAPALDNALRAHLQAGNHRLLLDLSSCSYVDSGGLAVIMTTAGELRDDGLLGLLSPNPPVRRLLRVVGLYDHPRCAVFTSEQAALSVLALARQGTVL